MIGHKEKMYELYQCVCGEREIRLHECLMILMYNQVSELLS